jgi:hypothetical protein
MRGESCCLCNNRDWIGPVADGVGIVVVHVQSLVLAQKIMPRKARREDSGYFCQRAKFSRRWSLVLFSRICEETPRLIFEEFTVEISCISDIAQRPVTVAISLAG